MTRKVAKTGRELEQRVANAYREVGARTVMHDVELGGNQIDVYVELETPGRLLHRIAVEVKDWSRSVGINVINEFVTVAGLLRAKGVIDEGVIVSASGFSKQARNAAKEHRIRLLELADLEAVASREQAVGKTQSATLLSSPSLPQPVNQAQRETAHATKSTQAEAHNLPSRTKSLDAQILQTLYDYFQAHPGDHAINLKELIQGSGAERNAVISCVLGLQEKGWLEYNLTEGGESGLVWLTRLGTKVAKDLYPN